MSYQYPQQGAQPLYFPPPPSSRSSLGPSYIATQAPPLPPRPAPSPAPPGVQDITSRFSNLGFNDAPPKQGRYTPHGGYHQATAPTYAYRPSQQAPPSPAPPQSYEAPPPLPPRPASHASNHSPWQPGTPGTPATPASTGTPSYPPPSPWLQSPTQGSWNPPQFHGAGNVPPSNEPMSPPTSSPWQQGSTYNRPTPPPPSAEVPLPQSPAPPSGVSSYSQPYQQGYPSPHPSTSHSPTGTPLQSYGHSPAPTSQPAFPPPSPVQGTPSNAYPQHYPPSPAQHGYSTQSGANQSPLGQGNQYSPASATPLTAHPQSAAMQHPQFVPSPGTPAASGPPQESFQSAYSSQNPNTSAFSAASFHSAPAHSAQRPSDAPATSGTPQEMYPSAYAYQNSSVNGSYPAPGFSAASFHSAPACSAPAQPPATNLEKNQGHATNDQHDSQGNAQNLPIVFELEGSYPESVPAKSSNGVEEQTHAEFKPEESRTRQESEPRHDARPTTSQSHEQRNSRPYAYTPNPSEQLGSNTQEFLSRQPRPYAQKVSEVVEDHSPPAYSPGPYSENNADDASEKPPDLPPRPQWPPPGAISKFLYFRIPNAPASIPADEAPDYYTLQKCAYPDKVTYADLFWFTHIDVPGFRICGCCFEKHIRRTPFAPSFQGRREPQGPEARCCFAAPRIIHQLWPQALRTKDLGPVKEYMDRRARIAACHGKGGVTGSEAHGVKWFTMANEEVPGFLVCEACLEEEIVGTAFERRFKPYAHVQGQSDRWSCDLAVNYLRRGIAKVLPHADWPAFVSMARYRVSLPPCAEHKGAVAGTRKWYKPCDPPIAGVVICETCFLDSFAFTSLESAWAAAEVPHAHRRSAVWTCDFAPIAADFAPLRRTLQALMANPLCARGEITTDAWYRLRGDGGSANFDVCHVCHTGLVAPVPGLAAHFEPRGSGSSSMTSFTGVCDFSPASPRFAQYVTRLLRATYSPDWAQFPAYVRAYAAVPPCARRKRVAGRRWWLLPNESSSSNPPDLVVCDDCHGAAVLGTALAHLLVHTGGAAGSPDPLPRVCDLYSARMRALWTNACADPAALLPAFREFARHRHAVYAQTVPQCEALVAAAKARQQQHSLLSTTSLHYNNLNGIMGVEGIRYGPQPLVEVKYSYDGFATPWGAQGAAMGAQAAGLLAQGAGDVERVRCLEGRWVEVE